MVSVTHTTEFTPESGGVYWPWAAAVLLSFWFPAARIVMLDANGEMALEHVRARQGGSWEHALL
jgi:hypothetical protein